MSLPLAALGAIVGITAVAALLRRAGMRRVCPLCAGVAGTWVVLLVLGAAGWAIEPTVPALLLGASAVGLAQALERRGYPATGGPLPWKTAVVLAGLAVGYGLLHARWSIAVPGAAVLLGLALHALGIGQRRSTGVGEVRPDESTDRGTAVAALTERMRNCC